MVPDPGFFRERLGLARLLLVFTPEACGANDPLEVLREVGDFVDIVQVRPKPLPAAASSRAGTSPASEAYEWTRLALEVFSAQVRRPVVMVDDRVDVALALWKHGCAGVHLGQDDLKVADARRLLGPDPLVGLSTHSLRQVADAGALDADYLGFGPIFATATKGYREGVGPEAAWVASEATLHPLFPIGGIDHTNVGELARLGRIAVSSAILADPDPARAAAELRALLLA